MGGSIFSHDGILGGIFQDLCGIPIESHTGRDPNVIILAS